MVPQCPAALVALLLTLGLASWTTTTAARAQAPSPAGHFLFDEGELPRGLELPGSRQTRRVEMTPTTLRIRASASQKTTTIDPIEIALPKKPQARAAYVLRFAAPGRARELMRFVEAKLQRDSPESHPRVRLEADAVELIDLRKLAKILARKHQHLTIATKALAPKKREQLLAQITPFLAAAELQSVRRSLDRNEPLDVDRQLLPAFARERVGKFTSQRGPNCFRTALAFQDPALPRSAEVNSKAERGFHGSMINNDELWWALSHRFVEVDTRSDSLRYGDVIVFFDGVDPNQPMSHRWLKHASTYLFGDYTFSKESYAADSPYTVKSLTEEWRSWQERSPQFGVKVYRYSGRKGNG